MPAERMLAHVPLAPLLTVPNPSSSSTGVPVTPQHVENWFSRHGSLLIGHGSQIAGIVLACIVIRLLVRKSINRVVRHTTKLAESRASTLLGGAGLVAWPAR
jgi:hypothetical protein